MVLGMQESENPGAAQFLSVAEALEDAKKVGCFQPTF